MNNVQTVSFKKRFAVSIWVNATLSYGAFRVYLSRPLSVVLVDNDYDYVQLLNLFHGREAPHMCWETFFFE